MPLIAAARAPNHLNALSVINQRKQQMTQAKSPLAWLGGKSRLADRIIDVMPDHQTYCEVFAGAAWVLFKKPESKVEIINDINSDLTNLYRCVKHHLG